MKTIKSLFLIAAVAAAVIAQTPPAQAYSPTEVIIPVSSSLYGVTNTAIYTNNSTAFTPLQGANARLVMNTIGTITNSVTLGFNTASDPNGTNFTTNLPWQTTLLPITNAFGQVQCYSAYVPATNFDAVVKGRLDQVSGTTSTFSIQRVALEYNF